MIGNKSQSAGGAAALVAAIAGLILLYILFLPPEDRNDLLGQNTTSPGTINGVAENSRLLLKESPGTLVMAEQNEFEHRINSFNLYEKDEDRILKAFQSIYVESSRGNIKKKSFAFSVDPEKTSNLQLSFSVNDHNGRLIIKINDEEVFHGEASGQVIVRLDKLQNENVVEFSTEEIGFQFWRTNYYEMSDIKITGTVKNIENLDSKQTFVVGSDEAGNIEKAQIYYSVECKVGEVGSLRIHLNDALIASGVPDCGRPVKFDIEPSVIVKGTNTIQFASDKGTYLIDQIRITTDLKQAIQPIYYFEVNSTKYSWVVNNTFDAILRMSFVDDGKEKRAELNINNRKSFMDARSKETNFSKDISPFIIEGNNFIRITPTDTLNIVQMTISLE